MPRRLLHVIYYISRPRNGLGFYLAARPKLLKEAKELWDLKGFLQHFDFPSLDVAVKDGACIDIIDISRLS